MSGFNCPSCPSWRQSGRLGWRLFACLLHGLLPSCLLALAAAGALAQGLESPPQRSTGDMAALRRCVDNLFVDYGVRDLAVRVETIDDQRQPAEGGTAELLLAAASDITQRSRAVRLLGAGAAPDAQAARPAYALRGSLRRLEGGAGGAGGRGTELLGLDLSLVSTSDASVVPGTASRTTVAVGNGQAELRKFGTQLSVPGGAALGQTALRALADVAVIELLGRLARVPYWSCFGASTAEPQVAAEVQDWYDALAARPAEIIGWFQQQLRTRRLYDGPVDGTVNGPLKQAVARYREALGLSRESKLTLDFFQAYLAADHRAVAERLLATETLPAARPPTAVPAGTTPAIPSTSPPASPPTSPPAAPAETRLAGSPLSLVIASDVSTFNRGQPVRLVIKPSRDAHVYCFLQDENQRITRFFPNRFQRDSRITARSALQLPGAMRFEITMNPRGVTETVSCFGTDTDVLAALPADIASADFAALPLASLGQLRGAFASVTNGTLAQQTFELRARP